LGASGIPVVVMGLGEIGRAVARAALARPDLRLAAAVDPALAGRRLGDLLGGGAPDLIVAADATAAWSAAPGGVVLHATGSSLEAVLPQIEESVRAGLSVISTCEELAYPWLRHQERAEALDALAEERNVAVLGTGVNPGFVLDRLPAMLSQVAGHVRHVRALRVVDVTRRRLALRRKVGAGMTEEAFEAAVDLGEVGHVGLAESAALAARGCGIDIEEVEVDEEIAPLIAEEDGLGVKRGQVAGVHQEARLFVGDREVVRLELTIALGAQDPRDEVEIDAEPPLRLVIPGGVAGDEATANAVVNAAHAVAELRGLVTVLDLPAGR
jgi:4-hydroxy-tetrahydrodipicolinate reductase